jgi:hypothetical protein
MSWQGIQSGTSRLDKRSSPGESAAARATRSPRPNSARADFGTALFGLSGKNSGASNRGRTALTPLFGSKTPAAGSVGYGEDSYTGGRLQAVPIELSHQPCHATATGQASSACRRHERLALRDLHERRRPAHGVNTLTAGACDALQGPPFIVRHDASAFLLGTGHGAPPLPPRFPQGGSHNPSSNANSLRCDPLACRCRLANETGPE